MKNNIHENILLNKYNGTKDEKLKKCLTELESFKDKILNLNINNKNAVNIFVKNFNDYRTKTAYIYEERKNSGQELIRSSMMEGFFQYLFKDILKNYSKEEDLVFGRAKTLVGFNFSPFSFENSFKKINLNLLEKDQDFVIGRTIDLNIGDKKKEIIKITIPFIIIECKVYIEKNMLETHMNSSSNIKKIVPDCLYFVVSEYMKMKTAEPHLSKLDNVYILCKEVNSIREKKFRNKTPITRLNTDLVYDIFSRVQSHLELKWWDNEAVSKYGRLID